MSYVYRDAVVESFLYESSIIEEIEASVFLRVQSLPFLFNACSGEAAVHDVKPKML